MDRVLIGTAELDHAFKPFQIQENPSSRFAAGFNLVHTPNLAPPASPLAVPPSGLSRSHDPTIVARTTHHACHICDTTASLTTPGLRDSGDDKNKYQDRSSRRAPSILADRSRRMDHLQGRWSQTTLEV